MPYTLNDVTASENSATGQITYSLPNGDSVVSAGRTGIGYTDSGLAFLRDNLDSKVNTINQQELWNREDLLRKQAEAREDTSLDRLVEAGKRNGINPIFLFDALSGNTGTAASYATSAAKTSNYESNEKTSQANSAKIVGAIVAALAMVAGAMIAG